MVSEELMPIAWHPNRWWNFSVSEDEKKNLFFLRYCKSVCWNCILNSYFPATVFTMVTSKKFTFCNWFSFSVVYCFVSLCLFKILGKLWDWYSILNLVRLSTAYLLYVSKTKFVVRISFTALSFKRCGKGSDITTTMLNQSGQSFPKYARDCRK